jgi:hypothetical protein
MVSAQSLGCIRIAKRSGLRKAKVFVLAAAFAGAAFYVRGPPKDM